MEDIKEKKRLIRDEIAARFDDISEQMLIDNTNKIESSLFDFANFLEAKIVLLYANRDYEVNTQKILKICLDNKKIIALPVFNPETMGIKLLKIQDIETDLKRDENGALKPDPLRCKIVPIDCIDIAIIPGVAFDEKGGRIGCGDGFYDRLLPHLPATSRKVALAFESQIMPQLPLESHDKHVDIIITEKRTIYKI